MNHRSSLQQSISYRNLALIKSRIFLLYVYRMLSNYTHQVILCQNYLVGSLYIILSFLCQMCIFLTFCDRLLNCYCWTILNKSSNGLPQWPLPTCPGSDIQKLQQYSDSQTILDHSIYLIIERLDNTGGETGQLFRELLQVSSIRMNLWLAQYAVTCRQQDGVRSSFLQFN